MDRYKQLLLKQRDIMIALTQRLVERDEQIMSLQDELDAYVSIFLPQYTYIHTYISLPILYCAGVVQIQIQ